MLARAIREGIGHDGRTLPPVRNALPATRLPDAERARIAMGPRPITEPVPAPAPGDSKALGRYLISVAD
jgi:hypothetical protein